MTLSELYIRATGYEPDYITPLTPAGSNRRYFRLSGKVTLIGVEGTSREENEAFIYLAGHFAAAGMNVPEVMAVSDDRMSYLLTDLGDTPLFSCLDNRTLLEKTVRALAHLHANGAEGLDFSRCFPVEEFDERSVMWDLNYFKYSFLNTSGIVYDEPSLQNDFERLAARVADLTRRKGTFMYRDFQSRNVMVKDGEPWFIDFQGGRRGPAAYDLASFIYQAKAGFDDETRNRLTDVYIKEASVCEGFDPDAFRHELRLMALVRSLQTLGAYGLRGRMERKPHFLQSIPPALAGLRRIAGLDDHADQFFSEYPCLMEVIDRLTGVTPRHTATEYDGLTVRVSSFSFKKGLPDDPSGNGGGFVFDCRAMDNPGRYEQYRSLTGLDRPVIEFLEERGEITKFLDACYSLVDTAVANYLSRGFTSLCISYGCTGGQHRSVYSAEHTARHIKALFPGVRVILNHREQKILQIL